MNGGDGPDILGLCEVENLSVLNRLISGLSSLGRNYDIAHFESEDKRGIDIAFIYDSDKFVAEEKFTRRIIKRSSTRDILQVNFKTPNNRDLILIGNHWPARMGGVIETEPYRIIAAETLSYWLSRIIEIKGSDICVLVMGDFNDDPFSRSLTDYALSTNSTRKVINSRTSPRLYNLMLSEHAKGITSYYHQGFPFMFDQFLASKGMLKSTSQLKVQIESASVNNFDIMTTGSYKVPRRFGRPSKKSSYDEKGFSDHFPISVILEEK
jgi:predicted extracellular nuclease